MKKALVIGGSNGIGLAIACQLISKGYFVEVIDKVEPDPGILPEGSSAYTFMDMLEIDEELISSRAQDGDIELLMLTAGFGRIADFEYMHTAEIGRMMTVNATSTIRVIRLFYDRIKSDKHFMCGVMCSIAGLVSTPSAAVYAASKAALCRFIESVNVELEVSGTGNRILAVAPSAFKGSRFYHGENDLGLLKDLAEGILAHLYSSDELFIPQYEETLKGVIDRYREEPHAFGLSSYYYKKESGRLDNERRVKIGFLSGTFDLFHIGHLNLLRRAKSMCDYLIVGVHDSGKWKGKETFIPFDERKEIIASCRYVDKVVDACVEDSDAWELWHFDR
ncbi:MAG: SDR family NAD(P)-dependent oxidoreductase, partial [Lachnospiraceae bacterium]|nr:SDR family NAD(P)-dependent oxidoreductase [Lachnospiraceae bacterium]